MSAYEELPETPDPSPCDDAEGHAAHWWDDATRFCYGRGPTL